MYDLLQQIWHRIPTPLRERVVRLIESTYTVGVLAVLVNEHNHILFLRNRFRYSTSWQLPGGFVKGDEGLEDGLRREIREETGYEAEVLALISVGSGRPGHLDITYLCRVVGGSLVVDHREVLDARFVPFEDLPGYLPEDEVRTIALAMQANYPRTAS
jgi:8-oxo-dGTP diphosphatase